MFFKPMFLVFLQLELLILVITILGLFNDTPTPFIIQCFGVFLSVKTLILGRYNLKRTTMQLFSLCMIIYSQKIEK